MPERPLLILPAPGVPVGRRKKPSGRERVNKPGRARQGERLSPRFAALQRAFERRAARLQTEAVGVTPEEVIVLETVSGIKDFVVAVRNVKGMEWLGELEEENIPPDDDFFALSSEGEPRPDKPLRGRLFLVFANQEALNQLLSLWRRWQAVQDLPRGLSKWRTLFEQLRDVRTWGVRDRLLETGVLDDWNERVEHGQEVVPCEVELWYRSVPQQRHRARERVSKLIVAQGGEVVAEAEVEDIAYHALLARVPVESVRVLLEGADETALVQGEQIQFFRASGQMAAILPDDERQRDTAKLPGLTPPVGEPVIALFDGLPLQQHRRLQGRLIIDDPDNFEADYPASERRHGTTMASLIVNGDLALPEVPLSRPLYVRPILRPDPRDWRRARQETVPERVLVVDLLHRAVRRLFEGEGGEQPAAPTIVAINLSIGIRDRIFDGSMSPLARLLDWLAWRYQVLFVVSAGNHAQQIELSLDRGQASIVEREELQREIITAVAADVRHRRLLSPAEAANALTVASVDADGSTGPAPPQWIDPFVAPALPSPINAQGMGYRRAIKPDLLAPGGRVVVRETLSTTERATLDIYDRTLEPGQLAAAPGRTPGDTAAAWYSRGTSNATALTSRAVGLLYDLLDELRTDPGGEIIDTVPRAVWLKALIAHGADWGDAGMVLDGLLRTSDNSRQFKEYLTRILGYGAVDVGRVQECTPLRATAISGGVLTTDESHVHSFPLPPSLSGRRGHRRLAITLAWLTPVNPRHQSWRRADLWFAPPADPLRVGRQQADWRAVQRGTLQHEILDGEEAAVFVDDANLEIQVSCRKDAGALEDEVPYALVTTLEVAEEVGVTIYDEIRVRVRDRIRVAAGGKA